MKIWWIPRYFFNLIYYNHPGNNRREFNQAEPVYSHGADDKHDFDKLRVQHTRKKEDGLYVFFIVESTQFLFYTFLHI